MFPVKESVNIYANRLRNFGHDFPMYCGISEVDRSMVPRVSVQYNESFPSITSSSYNPGPKVLVENLYNTCEPLYNFTNTAVTDSGNNRSKHFYIPEEFYTFYPDKQNNYNEHCERNSYPGKQQRNTLKITLKKKRKRTMFTTEQIIALEEVFNKKPYVSREERMFMMKKLQISEKSIKVWFQNRRRLTDKRSKDYTSDSPSSEDMSDTISDRFSDRLTLIESNINQNTDEYGYVRLDNKTMSELVNVIDDYLSQNPSTQVEETIHPVESENKMIYEPISPVSVSEDSEEIDQRVAFETESSLQLEDIEAMLSF